MKTLWNTLRLVVILTVLLMCLGLLAHAAVRAVCLGWRLL